MRGSMESTSTLFPPWCMILILHRDGEVTIRKLVNDGPSTTTPETTTVLTNQLLCQLKAEAFDVGKGTRGTVVLHENECICYCYIEQEDENVFVKFPALCSAAVIATELGLHDPLPPMCSLYLIMLSGQVTGMQDPSCCLLSTVLTPAGWQLEDMTMTTLRSIQADADTFPF